MTEKITHDLCFLTVIADYGYWRMIDDELILTPIKMMIYDEIENKEKTLNEKNLHRRLWAP